MTAFISSREFNQNASGAKRRTADGPVFITDRGRPAHVLMSIAEYRRLTGTGMSLAEALADTSPEGDFDFDVDEFRDRGPARATPFEFDLD